MRWASLPATLAAVAALVATASADHWTDRFGPGGLGSDGSVFDLEVYAGELIAVGSFQTIGGVPAANIAAFDGTQWRPLGAGLGASAGSHWGEVLIEYRGELIVGGRFEHAGGEFSPFIARWNGQEWLPFSSPPNGRVAAMMVSGDNLLLGGYFTSAQGVVLNRVARWRNRWFAYDSGMSSGVTALGRIDGVIVAGGLFSRASARLAPSVAQWTGGAWSAVGDGFHSNDSDPPAVFDFHEFGGSVYATGHFDVSGDTRVATVARWNGSDWESVGSGFDSLGEPAWGNELIEFEGELVAVGRMQRSGTVVVNNVARLRDGDWVPMGQGSVGEIKCAQVFQDRLYVGGNFSSVGGSRAGGIAEWIGRPVSTLVTHASAARRGEGVELRWALSGDVPGLELRVLRAAARSDAAVEVARVRADAGWFRDDAAPAEALRYSLRFESNGELVAESGPHPVGAIEPFALGVFPNPATDRATISYRAPAADGLTLSVYDLRGRLLRHEVLAGGVGRWDWDLRDARGELVGSGSYFVRLRGSAGERVRRVRVGG